MTPRRKSTKSSSEASSSTGSSGSGSSSSSSDSSSSGSDSSSSDSDTSSSKTSGSDKNTPKKKSTTPPASASNNNLHPPKLHPQTSIFDKNKNDKTSSIFDKHQKDIHNKKKDESSSSSKYQSQKKPSSNIQPSKASAVYSSDTEEEIDRRKVSKPKSSATIQPKSAQQPPVLKKTVPTPPPPILTKKINDKRLSDSTAKNRQNEKDKKKHKPKSIFSPDNSTDSDTPPPKLTPMKSTSSAPKSVFKGAKTPARKLSQDNNSSSRSRSRSASRSSQTSKSTVSSTDSDSSDDDKNKKENIKKTEKEKPIKPPPVLTSNAPSNSSSNNKAPSLSSQILKKTTPNSTGEQPIKRGRGRPRKNVNDPIVPRNPYIKKKLLQSSPTLKTTPKTKFSPVSTSSSAHKTITSSPLETVRKHTRSLNAGSRKSKHVLGSSRASSDSESDTTGTDNRSSKKVGPKGPISHRKPLVSRRSSDSSYNEIREEERKCPLDNCDSNGHLSGKYDKHFTIEACPKYHNLTPSQCRDMYEKNKKREEDRRRAHLKSSSSTAEQRAYRDRVKENRLTMKSPRPFSPKVEATDEDVVVPPKRQADFSGVPLYDVRLFQEAQAHVADKHETELKSLPNSRGTKFVQMGKFQMEVWYQSPYPDEYARIPKLYLCEFCLKYMKSETTLFRHGSKCVWRHPPGDEVYRKDKIVVWEVDGKRFKPYCQNLCLLAKFFLDHKTLYYDVEPFLFYVMTTCDSEGCHTVGYFSKEKNSFLNYNVSCILTLPPYQRQGYGRLLIDFSYLLTKTEGKIGSPEKPLSDLGLISYRSYWKDVLLEYLNNLGGKQICIKDMCQEMAINSYDIVSTLQALGMIKYWKGKHIILKRQDVLDEYDEKKKSMKDEIKVVDRNCLRWTPFSIPMSNIS